MLPVVIRTECTYKNVSVSRLWEAITHPGEMRKWFFKSMHSFIPEHGFSTRFKVNTKGRDYVQIWQVIEVIPKQKISYQWRYGNLPGNSTVSFELFGDQNNSTLILTHTGTESFFATKPDLTTKSCTDGWKYFLCVRLKDYLAGKTDWMD